MMNNYTFMIDFQVSVLAEDSGKAREWIESKHFIKDADVCNFVNIPAKNVRITPTSRTIQLMDELGEGYNE